jgi:hypothetical protein
MRRKLAVLGLVLTLSAILGGVALAAASPSVVTGGTSSVGQTSAVLHGTVNPNGGSTTYFFQWGLTKDYGITGAVQSAGAGTTAVSVRETAGGLIPGATYHYRLVATNQFGTTAGADRAFKTTGHTPPGVTTGPAADLSTSGALLTGAVTPAGATTTWWFEWGATTAYGQQTTPQALAGSSPPKIVTASLQGLLAAGTLYHYRLVAAHGASITSVGSDQSFLTYPAPRPVPRVRATTLPHRSHRQPYVLTTVGSIAAPSWMPAQYACRGNVTIRYFRGLDQVHFTLAGVQPNCTFAAQTVFDVLPGHRSPVHLRVVIRYVSTPYLQTNRAGYGHVTLT